MNKSMPKFFVALLYVAFFALSFVGLIYLSAWAFRGTAEGEMLTYDAELIRGENVRTEYIVDQTLDVSDIALKFTPESGEEEIVSAEDCTITADLSSAGIKEVNLSYQYNDYTVYMANYYVEVYAVRHLVLKNYPSGITENADGSVTLSKGLELWAELDKEPKTKDFLQPTEEDDPVIASWESNTVIKLDETLCDITVTKDDGLDGYYAVTAVCGNKTQAFGIYQINGDTYPLSSPDRVLELTNKSGTEEKLTLVVTDYDQNFASGSGEASGVYYYTDAVGNVEKYGFSYRLENWASTFSSASYGEVDDRQYGSGMKATVGDAIFYATQPEWHKAVLNFNTTDIGNTYEEVLAQEEASASYIATAVEITEVDGKIYFGVGGTYTGTKEAFESVATSIQFNLEGNAIANGDGSDWTKHTFGCTQTIGEDGTFTFRYDITNLSSYCYTAHFGQTDGTNLTLGAEYNGVSFTSADGSVYTLTSVPNSTDGTEYWGSIGLKVQKAVSEGITYEIFGTTIVIDSEDRILRLTNWTEGSSATLTLYVTEYNYPEGSSGSSRGYYVYTNDAGETAVYEFSYTLSSWSSSFNSSNEELTENFTNPDYEVTIDGVTFYALGDDWHVAILGWSRG
jgi:hypothetical protein